MTDKNVLSDREREILQLVAEGLTNREIAQRLSISHNTVKVHLSNIFEKTGVASRTEATLYAIQHRIVDVPGGEDEPKKPRSSWVWVAISLTVVVLGVIVGAILLRPDEEPVAGPSADVAERWQALVPLPQQRTAMAITSYSNWIFSIAGQDENGPTRDTFRYDLERDIWEAVAPKPTAVTEVGAVLIGEKIYVPGGRNDLDQPINTLEVYDPRQNTWTVGAGMPEPAANYALTAYEGLLYLFGGSDGTDALQDVWIYDPEADAWRSGAPMPLAREGAAAVSLTDRIVVLGGQNESGLLTSVQAYYPSRDANGEDPWLDEIDLPQGRADFGAAGINNTIYVVGGKNENEGVLTAALQLISDEWINLDNSFERVKEQDLIDLVPVGPSLYLFSIGQDQDETNFWRYQALYYEIYIPYVN